MGMNTTWLQSNEVATCVAVIVKIAVGCGPYWIIFTPPQADGLLTDSKFVFKKMKSLWEEAFCEDVCNLILGCYKANVQFSLNNFLLYVMAINLDKLGSCMKYRARSEWYCTNIVAPNKGNISQIGLKISKDHAQPWDFGSSVCPATVFWFGRWASFQSLMYYFFKPGWAGLRAFNHSIQVHPNIKWGENLDPGPVWVHKLKTKPGPKQGPSPWSS